MVDMRTKDQSIALPLSFLRSQLVNAQALEIALLTGDMQPMDREASQKICEMLEDIANSYINIAERFEAAQIVAEAGDAA